MSTSQQKPSILNAVLLTIPLLVVFFVVYFAVGLVLSLVFGILLNIPIISTFVGWLFDVREDNPTALTLFAALITCYWAVRRCGESLCTHLPTRRLMLKLTGGAIIGYYSLALFVTVLALDFSSGLIVTNIVFIIEGLCIWFAACKYPDPVPVESPKPSETLKPVDTYIYLETDSGMTVRVPADRLDQYSDPIKPKKQLTPEQKAELREALKKRLREDRSRQP